MPKRNPEIQLNTIETKDVLKLRDSATNLIKTYGHDIDNAFTSLGFLFGFRLYGLTQGLEIITKKKKQHVNLFAFVTTHAYEPIILDIGQQVEGENVRLALSQSANPAFIYEDRSQVGNGFKGHSPTKVDLDFYLKIVEKARQVRDQKRVFAENLANSRNLRG